MYTKLQIINLGLGKIAEALIARIDPPQTSLERFMAAGYENWKRTEITKRRWVFAMDDAVPLALEEEVDDHEYRYKYALPTDCLRPVRTRNSEWRQRRRYIWSNNGNLRIDMVMSVSEAEFDPLFVEVLACRIAQEAVEYTTQSNTKAEAALAMYDRAVTDAGKVNAFIIGPESYTSNDGEYPFLHERF